MGLLSHGRDALILEKLKNEGRIRVSEIASELNVTEVTIRRDLTKLEKSGVLKKTYGGAVLAGQSEIQSFLGYRKTRNLAAKKIIGKLASQLISDGDRIFLGAGSSCYEIIPFLADKSDLTIIVNSLNLMSRLHEMTQHKIVLTGGQYRPETMDIVGSFAEATIAQLGGFVAFTSADDISVETGLSGADISMVSFMKQVLRYAKSVAFVGTRHKFDNDALYKIADIDSLDCIVTDSAPSDDWHRACKEAGIFLLYPESEDLQKNSV